MVCPSHPPTQEDMPGGDKVSHAALAAALPAQADHYKALMQSSGEAFQASDAPEELSSPEDAVSLDLETFDFSPFLREREEPEDILGPLVTAEQLFSYLPGPPSPAQPSPGQQGLVDRSLITAAGTHANRFDAAGSELFTHKKRDLCDRVHHWLIGFENMCIQSMRMEAELEGLLQAAHGRIERATVELLTRIDKCNQGRAASLLEQSRLARERSSACNEVNRCVRDLLELRDSLSVVQTAARTFPTGVLAPPFLLATTKEGLITYFEAHGVPLPSTMRADEHVDE